MARTLPGHVINRLTITWLGGKTMAQAAAAAIALASGSPLVGKVVKPVQMCQAAVIVGARNITPVKAK